MAGYVHQFDDQSPPSIFGVTGLYSTTDSYYYGAFAKTYFSGDDHRLTTAAVQGIVRNDYEDFLGSGLPVQTTDDLTLLALRYTLRVRGQWFLGPQALSTNYAISGDNALSGKVLEAIGLTGHKSNGLGLYAQYDSRDNQYSPISGQAFELHNVAYRKSFGGDVSFDTYMTNYQYYLSPGNDNVLALNASGRWTDDAPPSGYSSVELRGYVRGQYLAPHMISVEADERISITEKWWVAAFIGVAGLYGDDTSDRSDSLYPSVGVGAFYVLNDAEMVTRADIAFGKGGDLTFYLTFGQPF